MKTLQDVVDAAINERISFQETAHYFQTYMEAIHNPPEGVIGVGAITYAEQKLAEALAEE